MKSKKYTQLIACCLIGFYIMYNVFLVPMGFFVPRLSILVLLMASLLTAISIRIRLIREYWFLLGFILYSFLTGVLVAINTSVVIHQTLFLVESVLAGIIILNIANDKVYYRILIGMFALGSILTALYFFLQPSFLINTRLSFNEEFNANTLGVMLMYGIWCVVFAINCENSTISKAITTIVLSLFIFYILVQTGSRKAVFGTLGIIAVFIVFLTISGGGNTRKNYSLLIVSSVLILLTYIYYHYIDSFMEVSDVFFTRIDNVEQSGDYRTSLIKDSFRVFAEHPFFGVGLDNNRYYTIDKLYAHNSYVEILACTGIIGTLLFLPIFWRMLAFVLANIRKIKKLLSQPSQLYICTLIVTFLFICIGQINIYNQTHMFITYFILTFISHNTNSDEKKNSVLI